MIRLVVNQPALSLDGRDIYVGPTVGQAVWNHAFADPSTLTPPAPTLRREIVNPPFRSSGRLTGPRDLAVHVPRCSEMLPSASRTPTPNRSD